MIKWMVESIIQWSYGVTCWEVFSLGATPYPGVDNHQMLQHINNGHRLNQPALCHDEM